MIMQPLATGGGGKQGWTSSQTGSTMRYSDATVALTCGFHPAMVYLIRKSGSYGRTGIYNSTGSLVNTFGQTDVELPESITLTDKGFTFTNPSSYGSDLIAVALS